MSRVVVAPKPLTDVRTDVLDFSPLNVSSLSIGGVAAVVVVYSGNETSASLSCSPTIAGANTVNSRISGGLAGTIYVVTVTATFSDGTTASISYFLAVVPDAV